MRAIGVLLWIAIIAIGVWRLNGAEPPAGDSAGTNAALPCKAGRAMPANHRLSASDLECAGMATLPVGQYLVTAVEADERTGPMNFRAHPVVAVDDGHAILLVPLDEHATAAATLDVGMLVDVWCGESLPRIEAAAALAVQCPTAASAAVDCVAALSVPSGLRVLLPPLRGCRVALRPAPKDDR